MKIVCFGSLNLDTTYALDHIVQEGETLMCQSLTTDCGGKGLNQACAIAKAGGTCWMAGAIGQEGSLLQNHLEAMNIDCRHVRTLEDVPTGHAIIQKDKEGANCILVYGGANHHISTDHIDAVLDDCVPGDFLVLQNEINHLDVLMEKAHARGLNIFYTPAPVHGAVETLPLSCVDVLLCNENEGCLLAGLPVHTPPADILEHLQAKWPATAILLTLGSQGAWYKDPTQTCFQPAFSVRAADTTAAGDTFAGYLITALSMDMPVSAAMEQAAAAAAIAVQRPGASASIPALGEVQDFLATIHTPSSSAKQPAAI